MLFFASWVPNYYWPIQIGSAALVSVGAVLFLTKRYTIGLGFIIIAMLIWCAMDTLVDILRAGEHASSLRGLNTKSIQAASGVWAVVVAVIAIGARFFFASSRDEWVTLVVSIVVLVGLMIFQVAHEVKLGPDLGAALASRAQQLIPAALCIELAIRHAGGK